MNKMNQKLKDLGGVKDDTSLALIWAAIFSLLLVLFKGIAFILTGSMVVLTSLLDSLADSTNSFVNHYIYKISRKKADKEHPFGHGGFEVVGSLIQGMILVFFGLSLILESYRSIGTPQTDTTLVNSLPFAGLVLLASAAASFLILLFQTHSINKIEKRNERSLTLLADRSHYKGDVFTNLLAGIGVFGIYHFGLYQLDAWLGVAGGMFLIYTGFPILKQCFRDIVHSEVSPELQQTIVNLAISVDPMILGIHKLRSRELGPILFVDFHVKLPNHLNIKEAHDLADRVEKAIIDSIPRADILIHIDPESEEDQVPWQPSYQIPTSE